MIYNFIVNFFLKVDFLLKIPRFRKIIQILNISFIPTNLKKLPALPHPIMFNYNKQHSYINYFLQNKKQISFMTCKDLIEILKSKFGPRDKFNFLDFGAENIDFFLVFKKEFPKAITQDYNNNGTIDTWYVDTNDNGSVDLAFLDDNEDGKVEAVLIDENENGKWEATRVDENQDGTIDYVLLDEDEDGKNDLIATDVDNDGKFDKVEPIKS